jgi:hypothetical protein
MHTNVSKLFTEEREKGMPSQSTLLPICQSLNPLCTMHTQKFHFGNKIGFYKMDKKTWTFEDWWRILLPPVKSKSIPSFSPYPFFIVR